MLSIVSSVENLSEHPLAKAIVGKAQEDNITFEQVSDFKNVSR